MGDKLVSRERASNGVTGNAMSEANTLLHSVVPAISESSISPKLSVSWTVTRAESKQTLWVTDRSSHSIDNTPVSSQPCYES